MESDNLVTVEDIVTALRRAQQDCHCLLLENTLLRMGLTPKYPQSERVRVHLASSEALVTLFKEGSG